MGRVREDTITHVAGLVVLEVADGVFTVEVIIVLLRELVVP